MFSNSFCRYTLRCSIADDWGKVKLAFDLEVVALNKLNLMGVRRKRVKGDTWHYKRLCEDILQAAKLPASSGQLQVVHCACVMRCVFPQVNKKQCSRQLQCKVPCSIGNVVNSAWFSNTYLSSLCSTSHAVQGGGS